MALVANIIFVVIVLSYRLYIIKNDPDIRRIIATENQSPPAAHDEQPQKISYTDAISLGGLIGTIIFSGVYPFVLSPTLDYSVNRKGVDTSTVKTFNIIINNYASFPQEML